MYIVTFVTQDVGFPNRLRCKITAIPAPGKPKSNILQIDFQ